MRFFQNFFVKFDHMVAEIMLDEHVPPVCNLYFCIYAQKLLLQPTIFQLMHHLSHQKDQPKEKVCL